MLFRSPSVRSWMSKAVRYRVPDLTVLSYNEIPDDQAIKVVTTVEAGQRKDGADPQPANP